MISIGEMAAQTGVSIRTLRYYDEIGLLPPAGNTEAGYRQYDERSLEVLQQILFYRELGFALKDIAALLSRPDYDKRQALMQHRQLLLAKRQHVEALLRLVEDTLKGEIMMNDNDQTTNSLSWEATKERYAREVQERWGMTPAYRESEERQASAFAQEKQTSQQEAETLFESFASVRELPPEAVAVQELVDRWQAHITRWHYTCTPEILAGLGEMYVNDPRFTETLDGFGAGTARCMSDAIRVWCANR